MTTINKEEEEANFMRSAVVACFMVSQVAVAVE